VAHIVSVNVGGVRTVEWHGRAVDTGIWKEPVVGRVALHGVNLDGDRQADLRVHGGPDKAVYAYAAEDYEWWSEQLGRPIGAGTFGENLTVEGVELTDAVIGTGWRVGSAVLEISQPRLPCFKLGLRMADAEFVERFEAAERFGAYLRIVEEGDVGAGDEIDVFRTRTDPGIVVRQLAVSHARADAGWFRRVLADPDVPESWKDWAERGLARGAVEEG
jgi:MOSC domain-containing protein YiiM